MQSFKQQTLWHQFQWQIQGPGVGARELSYKDSFKNKFICIFQLHLVKFSILT